MIVAHRFIGNYIPEAPENGRSRQNAAFNGPSVSRTICQTNVTPGAQAPGYFHSGERTDSDDLVVVVYGEALDVQISSKASDCAGRISEGSGNWDGDPSGWHRLRKCAWHN